MNKFLNILGLSVGIGIALILSACSFEELLGIQTDVSPPTPERVIIIITATPQPAVMITPLVIYVVVTATPTPEVIHPPTPYIDATPTPTLNIGLGLTPIPPTAENSQDQVEIIEVVGVGDITAEQVVIRNNGGVVNLGGWTLSDGQENVFTFPNDIRLFGGGSIAIFTRVGTNTPLAYFWGRSESVFETDDMVILSNQDGAIVASVRIP